MSSNNTTNLPMPDDKGSASTGFIIWGAALVFVMLPGLALFYSGLSKHNNALSLMMLCMLTMAVVTIQFFLFGFSLAFSETGGVFIGDFEMGAITTVGVRSFPNTAPQIPSIAFMVYQMQFATITAALIFGSVPERTRFIPAMVFVAFWTTFVYDFVAYWSWGDHGWIKNMDCLGSDTFPCFNGGYDFAGGGPVHIASGFAGLAYCLVLGKRKHIHVEHHSLVNTMLGTGLLWFGWMAFNGGSAGAANTRAAVAATNTTLAAAAGALTWVFFDFFFTRKLSALSFCSGAVAGLVGVTPAAGYVAPWASIVIGIITAVICDIWCRVKSKLGFFDDSFEAFSIHGCGGFLGNILTGIFAQKWVAKLDGTDINGGWLDGFWKQIGYQIAGSAAIAAWSFVVTFILLFIINKIPGLHLRQTEIDEALGGDFVEMGEVAYMLVISEPDSEPLNENNPHTLGFRADGKRVSTADGLSHLNGPRNGEISGSLDSRRQVRLRNANSESDATDRQNQFKRQESEMTHFGGDRARAVSPVHSNGVINFAMDTKDKLDHRQST